MAGHRPNIWVSDLYGARAGPCQCLAGLFGAPTARLQIRYRGGLYDFRSAHEGAAVAGGRAGAARNNLADSTRRSYQRRLDRELNAIMVLAPTNCHGRRLRKRYGKVRSHLFTFLEHPEVPPDNNGSERELRPTATYRKVNGGFRSNLGADLFAGVHPSSAPHHDAETTRIRLFALSCMGIRLSAGLSRYGRRCGVHTL